MVARAFRGSAVAFGVLPFALGCSPEPRQVPVSTAVDRAPAVSATASWSVAPNSASAYYGDAAASAGDVNGDGYGDIIVGAWGYDGPGPTSGRAFLYYGSANGLDTTAAWTRAGDQNAEHLGDSVAYAGDVNADGYADVLVGAPNYSNGQSKEGRAMLFLGSASGPSQSPAWEVESNVANALFGTTLAAAGDVNDDGYADIIVGGKPGGVFLGSSSGLSLTASFVTREIAASAGDVNGDGYSDIITGYSDLDTGDGDCVFHLGSASGVTPTAAWSWVPGNGHFVNCGSGGDVNGDGYTEIVVADWEQDGASVGHVLVFHGGPSGPPSPSSPSTTFELTDLAEFALGNGDVNGDGYSDLFIGAPYEADGRAFVHLGSDTGLVTAAAWTADGAQYHAAFGFVATSAGDVNGDGFADLLVTAPQVGPNSTEGQAFVYHGDGCPNDCPDAPGGAGGEAGQGGASGDGSAGRGGSSAGRGGSGLGGRNGSGGTVATGGTSPASAGAGGESGHDARGDAGEASGDPAGGRGGRAAGSGGRAGGAAGSGAPPTGVGEEPGGCGCRVGTRSRAADALALVAALALLVARRRRR
jgi:hypothetical protein